MLSKINKKSLDIYRYDHFFYSQRSDETIVLQATVNGAVSWIQAGLPLKTLKIVLYQDDSKELNACFSKLKEKHIKSQKIKVSLRFTRKLSCIWSFAHFVICSVY